MMAYFTAACSGAVGKRFNSSVTPLIAFQISVAWPENLNRSALGWYDHTINMPTAERVTVTLPADLLNEVDRLQRNRSRFIVEAVRREVARRRRRALLDSLRDPHPETKEYPDGGLGDWTSDLPRDEGLVDVEGGIAVRWVEGQGWVEESA
jgi:hypothetical protein